MARFELSDWERGFLRVADRLAMARSAGATGPYTTCYNRFNRWAKAGTPASAGAIPIIVIADNGVRTAAAAYAFLGASKLNAPGPKDAIDDRAFLRNRAKATTTGDNF